MEKEKSVIISIRIPEELKWQAKAYAVAKRTNLNQLLVKLLIDELKKEQE